MIFGLCKQSYNQTLNIKTDFENCINCDVRKTLMTSYAFTFLSMICVLFNLFS